MVRDGAQVTTGTFVKGKGGSLQITASESVEVISISANGEFSSGLFTQSEGSGDAGDLTIDTRRLLIKGGGAVSAGTRGESNSGSLQITASESVELIGKSADGGYRSGLFAASARTISGDAGDLRIDTGRLLLRDGAVISSRSTGNGTAGDITITARDTLQADNG